MYYTCYLDLSCTYTYVAQSKVSHKTGSTVFVGFLLFCLHHNKVLQNFFDIYWSSFLMVVGSTCTALVACASGQICMSGRCTVRKFSFDHWVCMNDKLFIMYLFGEEILDGAHGDTLQPYPQQPTPNSTTPYDLELSPPSYTQPHHLVPTSNPYHPRFPLPTSIVTTLTNAYPTCKCKSTLSSLLV